MSARREGAQVLKHTLSVLVENKPGVLVRVAGLFARRGFNIDSLVVAETEDESLSRMTITVGEQDRSVEQITKQLHKLVNVLKITSLDPSESVERELLLLKVKADVRTRPEIMQMVELFGARVADVGTDVLVMEMTGTREKVSAFSDLVKPFGVVELMRTGRLAMSRGKKTT
jgi:acetolactate synthase-1/3 small subunit